MRGSQRLEDLPDLPVVGRRLLTRAQSVRVDAPAARQRALIELPPLPPLGPARRSVEGGGKPRATVPIPPRAAVAATAVIDLELGALTCPDESESPEAMLSRLAHAVLQAAREQLTSGSLRPGLPIDLLFGVDHESAAALPDADRGSVVRLRDALASAPRNTTLRDREAVRLSITHSGRHGVRQLVVPHDPAFDLMLDLGCVRREVYPAATSDGSETWAARTVATLTASYDRSRLPDATVITMLGAIRKSISRRSS